MRKRSHTKHRGCGCVLAIAWVVLSLVAIVLLNTCLFDDRGSWEPTPQEPAYYDRSSFRQEDGRYVYEGEGGVTRTTGIDVSDHQGAIDWQAVAADGIDFAMIRVGWRGNTEGYLHADECFEQNYAGASEAGIACGAYFYSQAISEQEALEEAAFALELLGGRWLDYPVVFDYEPNDGNRIAGIDGQTATSCAKAFCDAVRQAGYEPALYGNGYDLGFIDTSQLPDVGIWYAEYGSAPSWLGPYFMWQYTASGSVSGIETPADLNLDLSGVNPTAQEGA